MSSESVPLIKTDLSIRKIEEVIVQNPPSIQGDEAIIFPAQEQAKTLTPEDYEGLLEKYPDIFEILNTEPETTPSIGDSTDALQQQQKQKLIAERKEELSEAQLAAYEKYEAAIADLQEGEVAADKINEMINNMSEEEVRAFLEAYDFVNQEDGGFASLVDSLIDEFLNDSGDIPNLQALLKIGEQLNNSDKEVIMQKFMEGKVTSSIDGEIDTQGEFNRAQADAIRKILDGDWQEAFAFLGGKYTLNDGLVKVDGNDNLVAWQKVDGFDTPSNMDPIIPEYFSKRGIKPGIIQFARQNSEPLDNTSGTVGMRQLESLSAEERSTILKDKNDYNLD